MQRQIKEKYKMLGKKVERTSRGHDFKITTTDWLTGKKKSEYVEVKSGNSKESALQKKKKKQFGNRYIVERVGTGPFGIGTSTTRGGTKKSSAGMWGKSSSTPKKKSSKSSAGMWGMGSASMGGTTKKKRRKSKTKSGFWM